jgi:hypothetical protein
MEFHNLQIASMSERIKLCLRNTLFFYWSGRFWWKPAVDDGILPYPEYGQSHPTELHQPMDWLGI